MPVSLAGAELIPGCAGVLGTQFFSWTSPPLETVGSQGVAGERCGPAPVNGTTRPLSGTVGCLGSGERALASWLLGGAPRAAG